MSFTESITAVLSNYANFSGRASRSEFWWFYLFGLLLTWAAQILEAVTTGNSYTSVIVGLVLLVPSWAVGARRLHDKDRSGWWQLLIFTIIGIPVLTYWFATPGTEGENRFGIKPEK